MPKSSTPIYSLSPTLIRAINERLKRESYDVTIDRVLEIMNINNSTKYILCTVHKEKRMTVTTPSIGEYTGCRLSPKPPVEEKRSEKEFISAYDYESNNRSLTVYDSFLNISELCRGVEHIFAIDVSPISSISSRCADYSFRVWFKSIPMFTFSTDIINVPFDYLSKTDRILLSFDAVNAVIPKFFDIDVVHLVGRGVPPNTKCWVRVCSYVVLCSKSELGLLDGELFVL